jgi:hypothetical protein
MEEIARRYVELSEDWADQLECLFSHISRRRCPIFCVWKGRVKKSVHRVSESFAE